MLRAAWRMNVVFGSCPFHRSNLSRSFARGLARRPSRRVPEIHWDGGEVPTSHRTTSHASKTLARTMVPRMKRGEVPSTSRTVSSHCRHLMAVVRLS